MTIVEVLVAATVLLIGIASTFAVVGRGQRLGLDAQREEQAVGVAQREMEALRALPYANLALKSAPASVGTACNASSTNPNDWLRAGSPATLLISTNYRTCDGATPAGVPGTGEPLVCSGTTATGCATAAVDPGPTAVTLGDGTTGKVYRYVSYRLVVTCTAASSGCAAADTDASKRITVAVVLDAQAGGGVTRPVWTSTIRTPVTGT